MSRRAVEPALERVHHRAAGIDIGSSEHWVSIPPECDPEPVRKFGCFTADLHAIVDWLQAKGITTVAMESTGVYWIPLFQILETKGLEVRLVNAHFVKTVPGRKSDVLDCQWLQKLHSYGLLSGSFRPANEICVLRSYIRQRDRLTKSASVHIQRMQKALTEMNIQLHRVVSDITGVTGMAIIRAIMAGKRDTSELAALKDPRAKSSVTAIAAALEGDYRAEHLFVLSQELSLYDLLNTSPRGWEFVRGVRLVVVKSSVLKLARWSIALQMLFGLPLNLWLIVRLLWGLFIVGFGVALVRRLRLLPPLIS
jgi:transposase